MTRPPKDVALRLLAGKRARLTGLVVTEDETGPVSVDHVDTTGPLITTPEALGWTQAELEDPNITE